MSFAKITERQREKVLKTILVLRKPNSDIVIADKNFYSHCAMPLQTVEQCLNSLAAKDIIELIPPAYGSYPKIIVLQAAYSYFTDKRIEAFKYWFPIVLSNLIAIAALIVAILALLK